MIRLLRYLTVSALLALGCWLVLLPLRNIGITLVDTHTGDRIPIHAAYTLLIAAHCFFGAWRVFHEGDN